MARSRTNLEKARWSPLSSCQRLKSPMYFSLRRSISSIPEILKTASSRRIGKSTVFWRSRSNRSAFLTSSFTHELWNEA